MTQLLEQECRRPSHLTWEIKSLRHIDRQDDIHGVLFLDVDGTLTKPGSMYAIDNESLDVLSQFVYRGGTCVFNTGATLGRLERTVLSEMFYRLNDLTSMIEAKKIFQERIIAAPENGSAVCLSTDVEIVEKKLNFCWRVMHPLEVPSKEQLRELIQHDLVPLFKNSIVVSNVSEDANSRQYILSWKGIKNTKEYVQMISEKIAPHHPEIDWDHIAMKAARKTIDFVHSDSGKKNSTEWILNELGFLEGHVLGFGDLGDEFALVVPTINVNRLKPNEFRMRGMGAMELNHWKLLENNGYMILGEGNKAIVRSKKTDKEIQVLRNKQGDIIFARKTENGHISTTISSDGYPVEIIPYFNDERRPSGKTGDAGKGTAWMLRELMNRGYFSIDRKPNLPAISDVVSNEKTV